MVPPAAGWVDFAIALGWLNAYFHRFADRLALKCLFKARDNILVALQVGERIARLGLVEDCAFVVLERVVHGDDCVCCDLHDLSG